MVKEEQIKIKGDVGSSFLFVQIEDPQNHSLNSLY